MNKKNLIDRVRKLYAMSQDSSSPNEAAIAARRARHLMDKHGIKAADLETSEFGSAGKQYTKRQLPLWLGTLAYWVAELNDCAYYVFPGRVEFAGYEVDAVSANLMLEYLVDNCNKQARQYLADNQEIPGSRVRTAGYDFRIGYAVTIAQRVKESIEQRRKYLMESDGRSLVVIKRELVDARFPTGPTKERGPSRKVDAESFTAGQLAGQRAGLNRSVTGATEQPVTIGSDQ